MRDYMLYAGVSALTVFALIPGGLYAFTVTANALKYVW